MSRHVVNHKEFTDRLERIARNKPDHIQKYITTVVRKYFLKHWDKVESVQKPPRGVPIFYGMRDKNDVRHDVAVPYVLQTRDGPIVKTVFSDDPMYQQIKSGDAVFLDLDMMAEIQHEVNEVVDWLMQAHPNPRDLTAIAFVDAKKKMLEWREEIQRREERQKAKQREEARMKAMIGTVLIHTIRASFNGQREKEWFLYNLTTEESLIYEGLRLHHCVAGYWYAVARGETMIWSLREKPEEPQFTIQISPVDAVIEQARGVTNNPATDEQQVILRAVADLEGLDYKFVPHYQTPKYQETSSVNIERANPIPWRLMEKKD